MTGRVTLGDLETKLRELRGSVVSSAGEAAAPVLGYAAVSGAVLVAAVYLLGRRRGRKEAPILEIRRV
ncbi:MAG: hypothetical protein M0T79_06415 [Actinomycetota bacterium]|jgi:hypothetical protein|nr:hypothetical protein [Actinomycetota bacterium]